MTKQEILDKYVRCECWPAKNGGKVYNSSCPQHGPDPESAMDEWAKLKAIAFAKWAFDNCAQDLGDPNEERWCYMPEDTDTPDHKTSDELYELYELFLQTSIK